MTYEAIPRRNLDEPRTTEALREPANIRRRPIKLPPMKPIKADAIGSEIPDMPSVASYARAAIELSAA